LKVRGVNQKVRLKIGHLRKRAPLFAGFPLAGLISGLLGLGVDYVRHPPLGDVVALLVPGTLFGLGLSLCLWIVAGVRSVWRIIGVVCISQVAFPLSGLAALLAFEHFTFALDHLRTRTTPVGAETYFAGGFTGSFIVMVGMLMLVPMRPGIAMTLGAVFGGSIFGGLLAIAGEAATSLIRREYTHIPHPVWQFFGPNGVLLLIWQTGMGFLLSVVLGSKQLRCPKFSD